MYRPYVLLHTIQSHKQSSRLKLPSVLNLFRQANDRMNGRAPKTSNKAIEYAFLNFDLDAGTKTALILAYSDLSSLFNWNTKQVFAYLVADYSASKYVPPRKTKH